MPWCPKCGTEYREGFAECADCHVALTNIRPAAPEPEAPHMPPGSVAEPVPVYEAATPIDAEMICEILRNADIPALSLERDDGLLKTYSGTSLSGSVILVGREQADAARECLRTWAEQDERAPISEEALAEAALTELPEEELARQAEAEPPASLGGNGAFHGMRAVLVALMLILACVLIAYGQVQG